jgi:hypothetical protein
MRSRTTLSPGNDHFAELADESLQGLKSVYYLSGTDGETLRQQLAHFEQLHRLDLIKQQKQQLEQANKFFGQRLAVHTKRLQAFVDSGGDLYVVSPWYLSRAAEFFEAIPELADKNALIAKHYQKKRSKVEDLFGEAHQLLEAVESRDLTTWMRQEKETALAALSRVSQRWAQTVSGRQAAFGVGGEQQ